MAASRWTFSHFFFELLFFFTSLHFTSLHFTLAADPDSGAIIHLTVALCQLRVFAPSIIHCDVLNHPTHLSYYTLADPTRTIDSTRAHRTVFYAQSLALKRLFNLLGPPPSNPFSSSLSFFLSFILPFFLSFSLPLFLSVFQSFSLSLFDYLVMRQFC